jgi:hypothetical protein
MNVLNCNAGNAPQVARDAAQIKVSGAQWVRVETAMSAITGLPRPPLCAPPAHEFDRLTTLLSGIRGTGAQPLLNILGWHYPPSMRHEYSAWLTRLLVAAPDLTAFEIGDEPNLSVHEISWPGASPDEEPYGWDFNAAWFSPYDGVGLCPSDPEQLAAFGRSVARFVTWIADSYELIKARRPAATVLIGGISSWRPACWLRELGRLRNV